VSIQLPRDLTDQIVDELRDQLYAAVRESRWVTLEAAQVEQLSSAAAGVLVAAALFAQQLGGGLIVEEPSRAVRDALRGFHCLRDVIQVHRSSRPAITALAAPPLPRGWWLDSASRPASPVGGGDLVICQQAVDGRTHLIVADVSGHGAAVAGRARRLQRLLEGTLADGEPEETLPRLNGLLLAQQRAEEFVTALHVAIDLTSGDLQAWSAGHPPPAVWHPDTHQWELLPAGGRLLGIFDDLDLAPAHSRIPPGGLLVAYTDGAVERRGESLDGGLRWLLTETAQLLMDDHAQPAHALVTTIAADTDDDVTLVTLHRDR
jgi:serine phosphatase RsbU (regulator of sigma subunit)